jgi:hypothetical protein
VVEHSLSKRKVEGSIPPLSCFLFFIIMKVKRVTEEVMEFE